MEGHVMTPEPIERWHRLLATGDPALLDAMLAEDVVFQSPVVHSPQAGKAVTKAYLAAAIRILNNGTFRYPNEWYGERSAVLEFEAEIDGITLNGVDIIHWNAAGLITGFKVMVRPLKAINLLHDLMARELRKAIGIAPKG
jgi:hypothetical protein